MSSSLQTTNSRLKSNLEDNKRSPSQQKTVKLAVSAAAVIEPKLRGEKTSLDFECESDFSFGEDADRKKSDMSNGQESNQSVDEYETACAFLKIVPSKMVIKSLPLSQICLSNYGINHNAVHALAYALKVLPLNSKAFNRHDLIFSRQDNNKNYN